MFVCILYQTIVASLPGSPLHPSALPVPILLYWLPGHRGEDGYAAYKKSWWKAQTEVPCSNLFMPAHLPQYFRLAVAGFEHRWRQTVGQLCAAAANQVHSLVRESPW